MTDSYASQKCGAFLFPLSSPGARLAAPLARYSRAFLLLPQRPADLRPEGGYLSSRPSQYLFPAKPTGTTATTESRDGPFEVAMDRLSPQFQAFLILCALVSFVGYILIRAFA